MVNLPFLELVYLLCPMQQLISYNFFEEMLVKLKSDNWINVYISWELSLIKELGFGADLKTNYNIGIKKALTFNRNLLMKNFFIPNSLKFPLFRNILENYFL